MKQKETRQPPPTSPSKAQAASKKYNHDRHKVLASKNGFISILIDEQIIYGCFQNVI